MFAIGGDVIRKEKRMKTKLYSTLLLFLAMSLFLQNPFGGSGVLYAQNDPSKEILVYFTSGIDRAPAGRSAAVRSSVIQRLMTRFNINASHVTSAFPDFKEADTLKRTADRRTINLPNMGRIFRIQVPDSITGKNLIDSLKKLPNVAFAEPNINARLFSDPTYGNQWYLNNTGQSGGTPGADIKAEQAWTIFTGSSSITIGIVDCGVQLNHEDLSGKITGDAEDGEGHGTHVAGITAAKANNDRGGRGVDWNAQILSKQIFSTAYISYPNNPDGYMGDVNTYNKIVSAVDNGATILNNSWGGPQYSTTLRMAFAYAYKANRVAAVAMGNNNGSQTQYPAGFGEGIIAVGATQDNDAVSSFSDFGNHIDVAAPGGTGYGNAHDIWSTWINNSYTYLPGTSMATPVVSGIASLLKGYNSNLYNDDIEHIIQLSADKVRTDLYTYDSNGWNINMGYGRVNAKRALDYLRPPYAITQATATGGTDVGYTAQMNTFYGVPGLNPVLSYVMCHEVQKNITFPTRINPAVWGRGVATTGWSTEYPNYAMGWCDAVPGTVTSTSATLRTYVYQVYNSSNGTWTWYPITPQNAVFAYTVFGQVPLSVSISGPQYLGFKQMGTWTANPSNGSGNYSYQWYVSSSGGYSWTALQTARSQSYTMVYSTLIMRCVVHDNGYGQNASGQLTVYYGTPPPNVHDGNPNNGSTIVELIPAENSLSQNYPNPFNPSTEIRFGLTKPVHTRLVVYDMLGREVAKLADENMDAGYHSVTWNASNVSSGIYIYKLSAGDFVQIRRMVVMK
jgi:subtilisin family serine protease